MHMYAHGGLQTSRLVIFDTETFIYSNTHRSTKCYQFHLRLSLLAPPAEWQPNFSNAELSVVLKVLKSSIYQKLPNLAHFSLVGNFLKNKL